MEEKNNKDNSMHEVWDYYNNVAAVEPDRRKHTGKNTTRKSKTKKRKAKNRLQKQARKKNR